ncbi:Probable secretion ATPase protein [gamma proteobacterium HdN1]|nr:Probable secretion ATPase protein [gamma proteobacterium HdN1]
MLEFEIIDSYGNRTSHSFERGTVVLGKGDTCNVILPSAHASRVHANIRIEEFAAFYVDSGSTNGSWFRGARLSAPHKLGVGDRIDIGDLSIVVQKIPEDLSAVFGGEDRSRRNDSDLVRSESDELVELKRKIHSMILEYLDLRKRGNLQQMTAAELRTEADKATREIIRQVQDEIPGSITHAELRRQVVAEAVGLGALEPLLQDDSITEIMVNGPDQIFIEQNGKLVLSQHRFSSTASLLSVIDRVVAPLGRRIDESSPMVDARLPDGSRVNAIIPPLALNGPTVTIRKFAKKSLFMQDLFNYDSISVEMARFLKTCVEQHRNIIISGGTGSGKTTTLNILSNFIGPSERIVTIEDAAELRLNQTHVVSMESRPANAEGKGRVTIRDLVVNALRMRPDRIVVGECRGGEALDMLQAMNTGHDGSLTTGHANSPSDFLARLEVMVLMAGVELPSKAIREQIASAVDIIVQQSRLSDGRRKITHIMEVSGIEGDTIKMQPIFEFVKKGIAPDGRVLGEFSATGYIPMFYREAQKQGIKLDQSIFTPKEIELSAEAASWN